MLVLLKALRLSRSELIIDWHNYGYSILRVNRVNKASVFLAKIYEGRLARWADHHLCVSKAMQADLVNKFGIGGPLTTAKSPPHVLYDKATSKFKQQLSIDEMHELYKRAGLVEKGVEITGEERTLFTIKRGKGQTA